MLNDYLTDWDKCEIITIGIQEGSVFINDEGIAVDAWDDPVLEVLQMSDKGKAEEVWYTV